MLSLILPLPQPEPALLETLAACVPAVAEGLIREAIVVTPQRFHDLDVMIDAAGCQLIETQGDERALLLSGANHARCDWLLVIRPGFVPLSGWMAEVGDFLLQNDPALIGLAYVNHKGQMWPRLVAQLKDFFGHSIFGHSTVGLRRVPPAQLLHRAALDTPQLTRRVQLDWTLADRRREKTKP
jgi:hypothetical protein